MKKKITGFLFCWMVMVGLVACQDNKSVNVNAESSAMEAEAEELRTADEDEQPDYRQIKDGLFDDFIYRFMQDSLFQNARIDFPLTYRVDGKVSEVRLEEWTYDTVYSSVNEYTSIYEGKEVVEQICDSSVRKATIEVVDLKAKRVKLYHFNRDSAHWILNEVDEHFFDHDNNHGFFEFYGRFSNDEYYQMKHIQNPFYFKTYDADNFQEIEGWVASDLWPDYRTYLPNEKLFNVIYDGQRPTSVYRRLYIGSPSSGMSCSLLFKRARGKWMLVGMEN